MFGRRTTRYSTFLFCIVYLYLTSQAPYLSCYCCYYSCYCLQAFAMHALANILDTAGGRTEFLGVSKVVARDGEDRGMAVRKHLVKRFDMFCVFLRNIQLEKMPEAGSDKRHTEDEEPVLPSRYSSLTLPSTLSCTCPLTERKKPLSVWGCFLLQEGHGADRTVFEVPGLSGTRRSQ